MAINVNFSDKKRENLEEFSNTEDNNKNTAKTADIIDFKRKITQFELTKAIYESEIFSKIKMTASSKLFLWALCTHFNPENADMFPAQTTVAKRLGMSAKSAERAVKELRELDLISWTTKRVNHYHFSEKFFEMVKMSVNNRQNVGSKHRQNVGLTNKHEQEKNIRNFSSFKNGLATINENSGSKSVPSVEDTQNYFKKMDDAAKKSVNPNDYTKEQAQNWLKQVDFSWMGRSKLVRQLVEKHRLEEFYEPLYGAIDAEIIKKFGLEKYLEMDIIKLETLRKQAQSG